MTRYFLFLLGLCFIGFPAFADIPGSINSVTAAVGTWGYAGTVLAVVAEAAMRIVPSQKPLSIMWIVANAFQALSGLFGALAKWLDSWLPQITK